METISVRRRIECAVSGGGVVLTCLVGFGIFFGGVAWSTKHSATFEHVLNVLVIALVTVIAGAIVAVVLAVTVLYVIEKEVIPTKPLPSGEASRRLRKLGTLAGLVWVEVAFLKLWPLLFPQFIPPNAPTFGPCAIILSLQLIVTAVGAIVWLSMSRTLTPGRIGCLFVSTQICFWMMWVDPTVTGLVKDVTTANLVSFALGFPIIGLILGAAYSCEKNAFDLILRR